MPSEDRAESKVPRARLSQIAARKLAAFHVTARMAGDGETLEGELHFKSGTVQNPLQGGVLTKAGFVVLGHDRLSFTEPPLSGLGPVSFYDAESSAALEARIAQALAQRVVAVKKVLERMKALRMETQVDPDRMLARGIVRTTSHAFEVWGGPEETRVARVTPSGGKAFEVPRNLGQLTLESFPTPADLEIHLSAAVPAWQQAKRDPATDAAPKATGKRTLRAVPPAESALSLSALKRLGDGVSVTYGAKLEASQEFEVDGARYRFVAVHERGATFSGKLLGPTGEKWAERFDLMRFPGAEALVSTVLKLAATEPTPPPPAPSAPQASAPSSIPEHLTPHEGEIWVMNVLIEQESNGEVRYVGMNTDGKPYGATRILTRTDFENVFALHKGGWRLNIVIEGMQGDTVLYRQLDSQRQPRGTQKKLAGSILVSTFVPESAAY